MIAEAVHDEKPTRLCPYVNPWRTKTPLGYRTATTVVVGRAEFGGTGSFRPHAVAHGVIGGEV